MNPRNLTGQCVRYISSKLKEIGFGRIQEIMNIADKNSLYFLTKPDEEGKQYSYRLTITFEGEIYKIKPNETTI
jgi:hypothetical protein